MARLVRGDMEDPSSISPSASAKEYLTLGLAGLSNTGKLGSLQDPVAISGLVDVCECASPEDAANVLDGTVMGDGKTVITEYLRRRVAAPKPGSVNDSLEEPFKIYKKPALSEATSSASVKRKPVRRKPKGISRETELSTPVKNEARDPVKQGKPCHCQARKHGLVNNCLHCGKIICKQEGFGPCNYCGTELIRPAGLEMSDAEAKANVFKDRLLGYDQNGHKQTAILDDQSSSSNIEGNVWISPEEKEVLQREELEAAANLHRNRTVLLLDPAEGKVSVACEDDQSNVSTGISGINDQFQNVCIVSNLSIKECPVYVDNGKCAQKIQSRHVKIPESTKVISGRVQHDKQSGASCFQPFAANIRLQKSFIPTEGEMARRLSPDADSLAGRAEVHKGPPPVAGERSRPSPCQTEKQVYHEASSPAFDICMPDKKAESKDKPIKLSPSLLVQKREKKRELDRSQKPMFQHLMPGMVLLKNWLSQSDQINIVRTCRRLGLGPGGFYQPGYGDSNKLHLWMMCLGKNWNPVSKSYENIRSYDNAVPPSLPAEFVTLVKRAVGASQDEMRNDRMLTTTDVQKILPTMNPDICLVNFYKQTGKLGMHQDKDESSSSIKRGLPVVSFSVGSSAEFVYGEGRGEEKANHIILESGDVLIFGGPSRLIYHGITRVIPHTSPHWLTDETNLCPGRINLTFRQL